MSWIVLNRKHKRQEKISYIWCNCETIMRIFDGIFSTDFLRNCTWVPASQFFFQMANSFLVISYLADHTSRFGLLHMRFALMMAGFCFAFWGTFILCSLDPMIWHLAFAIRNGIHFVYLIIGIILKKPNKDEIEDEQNSISLLCFWETLSGCLFLFLLFFIFYYFYLIYFYT